jgi:hypothetical protein
MKTYKMVGVAVAAFALASIAMAAAPRLVGHGIAVVQAKRAAAKSPVAPAADPAATDQQSALQKSAVAAAQEATSLPQ